jgi:hypothetical protein
MDSSCYKFVGIARGATATPKKVARIKRYFLNLAEIEQ